MMNSRVLLFWLSIYKIYIKKKLTFGHWLNVYGDKKKTRNTFLQHLTLSAIIDENASCLWMRLFPETERSDCLLIKLLWHLQGDFSSYQEISKWINLWSRKCWIVNCRGKRQAMILKRALWSHENSGKIIFLLVNDNVNTIRRPIHSINYKRCQWYWKTNAKLTLSDKYHFNVESDILAFGY